MLYMFINYSIVLSILAKDVLENNDADLKKVSRERERTFHLYRD